MTRDAPICIVWSARGRCTSDEFVLQEQPSRMIIDGGTSSRTFFPSVRLALRSRCIARDNSLTRELSCVRDDAPGDWNSYDSRPEAVYEKSHPSCPTAAHPGDPVMTCKRPPTSGHLRNAGVVPCLGRRICAPRKGRHTKNLCNGSGKSSCTRFLRRANGSVTVVAPTRSKMRLRTLLLSYPRQFTRTAPLANHKIVIMASPSQLDAATPR